MEEEKEVEGETVRALLIENQRLLMENNQLLRKMHRQAVISFWLKFVWFFVLIGAPFILYYYLLEPYFSTFGSSLELFQNGMQEIPGWKQFYGQ